MDKYIFLDFDGVLNSGNNYNRLVMSGLPVKDRYGTLFDAKCVSRLDMVLERTGAKIIVTSSWRYVLSLRELDAMWRERELPGAISDILPLDVPLPPNPYSPQRGAEIEEWFRRRRKQAAKCRYAIIDDVPDFLPHQMPHVVCTNPDKGFSDENVEQAVALLT